MLQLVGDSLLATIILYCVGKQVFLATTFDSKHLLLPILTTALESDTLECKRWQLILPLALRSHTLLPPPHSHCRTSVLHKAPWPLACCTNTCPRLSPGWLQGPSCCMCWTRLGMDTCKKRGGRGGRAQRWYLLRESCTMFAFTVKKLSPKCQQDYRAWAPNIRSSLCSII